MAPALTESLLNAPTAYPGLHGSIELRQSIAARYAKLGGDEISEDGVIATTGADGALIAAISSLLSPGDAMVVTTPGYTPFFHQAARAGATVLPWVCRESYGWTPDLDQLSDYLKSGARVVLANFPHNPTGFMPDHQFATDMVALIEAAGALLIADEVYLGLPDATSRAPSRAYLPFALRTPNAISIASLSKVFGLPGLRVGWIAGQNRNLINQIRQAIEFHESFVSILSERAGIAALAHEKTILARNAQIAQTGRTALEAFLAPRHNQFQWTPPLAGVNAFVRYHGDEGAKALCERMLADHQILLVHSGLLGAGDSHIRIGFGVRDTPVSLDQFAAALA